MPVDWSVSKTSALKTDIRLGGRYLAIGKNFSKMAITVDRKPKGTAPLEVFHASLRSIYCQERGSKGLKHLGMFPRKRLCLIYRRKSKINLPFIVINSFSLK